MRQLHWLFKLAVLYSFLSQWRSLPPVLLQPRSASSILQHDMDKVWSTGATEEKIPKIAPNNSLSPES